MRGMTTTAPNQGSENLSKPIIRSQQYLTTKDPKGASIKRSGQAMKIPVHEIDGDYYCAIDDIARFKAKTLKKSTFPLWEAEIIYMTMPMFWHVRNAPERKFGTGGIPEDLTSNEMDSILFSSVDGVSYSQINKGIYQVSNAYFLVNYGRGFFRIDSLNDPDSKPQRIEIDMLSIDKGMTQEDREIYNYYGAICDKGRSRNNKSAENPYPILKNNANDLYVLKSDADMYLAGVGTDAGLITPEIATADAKAEETQPLLEVADLTSETPLSEKERGNLYRIIYAMKETLLDENTKNDKGKKLFTSQNKLIEHLAERYKSYGGLAGSNLSQLYAKLNKEFSEAEKTFKNS